MPASNIETADHTWLAAAWPKHLLFLDALDLPSDDDPMESYQVVPRTYTGLREWAYVGRNPDERDSTRGLLLLYKHPRLYPNSPPAVLCPVGVRVQGFIERCNLKPLGSWTSTSTPQSAVQNIVLGGGKDDAEVFLQYKTAINEIVAYIHRSLDSSPPVLDDDRDTLFISRRVFTKITNRNRTIPSALEPGDDPMGYTRAIDSQWRIVDKVSAGMFLRDELEVGGGSIVPCDPVALSDGDFVDVCVGFDIVHRRNRNGGPGFQVHLKIEHVLLLASAVDIDTGVDEPETAIIQGPGLLF